MREVRVLARNALSAGAYTDAIGYLQQLIEWFGQSKKKVTIGQMEFNYYHLALCHYLLGQFTESEKAFDDYLKRYPKGPHAVDAAVYRCDGFRYQGKHEKALKEYEKVLKDIPMNADWETDVHCSIVRCYLANDDWEKAIPHMKRAYQLAPDDQRANWAVTLLVVAFLKDFQVEEVYKLASYLIRPGSVASRSVAFNVSALEAADALFADERYRDSLWIYRLIYPRDMIEKRAKRHLEELNDDLQTLKEAPWGKHRDVLRLQETVGELEEELKSIEQIQNYSVELKSRVARAYMETRRYWEARALYLHLYETSEDEHQVEECLYLAFHCSTQIKPWDRAFELGLKYMAEYPGGPYYDTVSVTIGQMYAMLKDWPNVIKYLTKALEVSPEHESAAECMFLIGYGSFMLEKFKDAVKWLRLMNTKYPGNERAMEGTYWTGMALMFDKLYEEALRVFEGFLRDFPNAPFVEDATFRRAVCEYGLSLYDDSEKHLTAFAAEFPESKLLGEAFMMLADISGTRGDLQGAVDRYQKAVQHELNIELYNYCSFRCGEMMNDLNDFPNIIRHFQAYLDRDREDSNRPLATYWIAKALWQLDKQQEAMQYLLKAVRQYGTARKALGVDLILDEWIGRSRKVSQMVSDEAWSFLHQLTVDARKSGDRTLALRLERTFLYRPGITDKAKELVASDLLREENLPVAPISVLEYIIDEAPKRGNKELAVKAAEVVIEEFSDTDTSLTARMLLARQAIDKEDYETAEMHLNIVRETFATSTEAAQALLILGDMQRRRRKYEEADAFYKQVLGVREWRGPLWPRALFGRGECARLQRKYQEATAFYERIYLMYSGHTEWVAKAYLTRAECLSKLRQADKARETLEEMIANKELEQTQEYTQARDILRRMKGGNL